MTDTRSEPDWLVAQRTRQEAATGPFHELVSPFLGLDTHNQRGHKWRIGGKKLPVLDRLVRALAALREFRKAHNQRSFISDEEEILAVRVVADELANQVQHAATTPGLDPNTIAWVLAGLRCPSTPFCTGCRSCFTITAPNRPIDGQVGA